MSAETTLVTWDEKRGGWTAKCGTCCEQMRLTCLHCDGAAREKRIAELKAGHDAATSEAAASVQAMDEKLRDMERQLWSIIASAGGKVCVPRSLLSRLDKPKWVIEEDVANDAIIYRVTI